MIALCTISFGSAQLCPNDADGQYPTCQCRNSQNYVFNSELLICQIQCPADADRDEHRNTCVCKDSGDYFDQVSEVFGCRTKLYLPSTTQPSPTPGCGAGQVKDKNGDCSYVPCPKEYEGDYWPYCKFNFTFEITPVELCPEGLVGSYPYCYEPCPPYTVREYLKENNFDSWKFD